MVDGIVPGLEHYKSMLILLIRAGLVKDTIDLLMNHNANTSPELWTILLSYGVGVHDSNDALPQLIDASSYGVGVSWIRSGGIVHVFSTDDDCYNQDNYHNEGTWN